MNMENNFTLNPIIENKKAREFCKEFIYSSRPKYIFGINYLADSISRHIEIDGYIDDFTKNNKHNGKPIVKIENIPLNALVVSVVTGKPIIAEARLNKFKFEFIDFFSFYKYIDLNISEILFWEGMKKDFEVNMLEYKNIYNLLVDDLSKDTFSKLINFKFSYDLNYIREFEDKEDEQYFESFLDFRRDQEVFIDIGGYDGFTSQKFIELCPSYKAIHFFEPEDKNMQMAKENLKENKKIFFYKCGLGNKKETLSFKYAGGSSKICENGDFKIFVEVLDDIIKDEVSFIKMDIEGFEYKALQGTAKLIKKYQPKLAISVYHNAEDIWKIPKYILSIRKDYKIYLRHYTRGIAETIMFFIPITNKTNEDKELNNE